MTANLDYQSVGLGISFQTEQAQHSSDFGKLHHDFDQSHYASQASQGHTKHVPFMHQRAQSAVVPQRPTFEQSFLPQVRVPRSAHPVQRPFFSPSSRFSNGHVQSAPTTPSEQYPVNLSYDHPRTEHREFPSRETVKERRQRRRLTDLRAPPQYMNNPIFMDSPVSNSYSRNDASTHSESSYQYMNASVQSTPYSEASQFPVSDSYSNSHYGTPNLMHSPVFEQSHERQPSIEEQDEMPSEPYVPTILTNFPPLRPSALRRNTADESRDNIDNHDSNHSLVNSPRSSPTGTPYAKDRKVAYSRWSSAEDLLLKDAIAKHGDSKWSLVSQMVPGRTPMQCSTRWQGALNTSIHKGRWDAEEDMILIKAVAEWQAWHLADHKDSQNMDALNEELYKNIPWSNIAQLLPRPRTGVQALARWSEALDPRITKGKWTEHEDACLLKGIERYGRCWIKIANCVQGRTQRQCRTRYCQISDKKRKVRGGPVHHDAMRDLHYSD